MERRDHLYQVGEFAALTGVSIRTLHHYDQIGLLRPSGRSEAGYRLYSEGDLLCLQQILTLRYLGFALKQIRDLLRRPDFDLVASLRIQRTVVRDRVSELQRIDAVLGALLERRITTGQWDWELVTRASAAVQEGLEQRGEHMSDYYTPEQLRQEMDKVGKGVPPEEIKRIEEQWTILLREMHANRDLDPASAQAQALADRWDAMTQDTFKWYPNDQKLKDTIAHNYEEGRYTHIEGAPTMEDFAFIERVKQARKDPGAGGAGTSGS